MPADAVVLLGCSGQFEGLAAGCAVDLAAGQTVGVGHAGSALAAENGSNARPTRVGRQTDNRGGCCLPARSSWQNHRVSTVIANRFSTFVLRLKVESALTNVAVDSAERRHGGEMLLTVWTEFQGAADRCPAMGTGPAIAFSQTRDVVLFFRPDFVRWRGGYRPAAVAAVPDVVSGVAAAEGKQAAQPPSAGMPVDDDGFAAVGTIRGYCFCFHP
ncbi:hypothetical protein B5V00_03770 [Geothermobacter hydrogeniphilus]|uniref:Uncharacterized protein n=1 Tax=Geothermobacter hydrogeniphilus TaxID=1969733 RepID=A0A1X0YBC8_9BACT|nr:hypothetical protein B5V00_03770 [Geothermobacter hydrogeniphilus]